jgi:hypothetical protein
LFVLFSERSLQQKREECRRLEDTLQRERSQRGGTDLRHGELRSEVASLRLKCARLERDLTEYRNTTPRLARPVHLASSLQQHRSPTPVSSPDDASPGSRKGGGDGGGGPLLLSDDETAGGGDTTANEMDTSMVSLSGRSTRGLRKILGRVSNPCSFDTDPDPDSAFMLNTGLDPDPIFLG